MIDKGIDLARAGISKSLMTTPCERKGFFSETVRDEAGRRLRFPMPERVTFGRAIDAAVSYIVWHEREGHIWTVEESIAEAVKAAHEDWPSWEQVEDHDTFHLQVANAIALFVGSADGLARLRPYIAGIRIQGDDGRSLSHEDIVGTPDFITADGGVIDLKTSGRAYNPVKFVTSAEMPVYALLVAHDLGFLPPFLAYQVYVRTAKPRWQWLEVPCTADHVALGAEHVARWRYGLSRGDAEAFGFDPTYCADCGFAEPIGTVDFTGCRVGLAVRAIAPKEEEA
jgi:hypothetical protein